MCTALSLRTVDHYFGRTLDIDRSYGEEVCILPRRYPLCFRQMGEMETHYALIGMATVTEGIPLFYDAVNEYGLAMAGLNFPGNAYYAPIAPEKDNVASFELIPWILCRCKTVDEARALLERIHITNIAFHSKLPPAPLHWMLSDKEESLVIEAMRDGLHVYQNPIGVMTNNPPFPGQLENLQRYHSLRNDNRDVTREVGLPYESYCQGLGALGLPGDVSSMSRFVRAAFGREHAVCDGDEASSVGQFFHLLSSVEMVRGVCKTDAGAFDLTLYTCCMNTHRGLYYYTTYGNRRITCIDMHRASLEGSLLARFPIEQTEDIRRGN